MGLGKTVQVVTAIRLLFNRAELNWVLVLCPKNLLENWEREFGRWAPELGIAVVTPSASIREQAWFTLAGPAPCPGDELRADAPPAECAAGQAA